MNYYNLFRQDFNSLDQSYLTNSLKGVFINSSYESNKSKCNEAYLEHFLYNEDMSLQTTVGRLNEICTSFMLPIKEIEKNALGLCSIKCEDFDVKVEIENTGPFSFNLTDDVYILPPIPCSSIDKERLKINIPFYDNFLRPLVVPRHEIANMYEDMMKQVRKEEVCFNSLLYKTYHEEVHDEMLNLILSGQHFLPSGYIVAKSSHEPPGLNAVTINPFQKFIMVITKPLSLPFFNYAKFIDDLL